MVKNGIIQKVIVTASYILMVVINVLANTLPINGVTTGEVSQKYPNLFAPAPITFAIWGLIYFLLGLYTLYYLGLLGNNVDQKLQELFHMINPYYVLSSIANGLWIISWHYDNIATSMLLMICILVSLIMISLAIRNKKLTGKDRWLIKVPFSIYFGWITIATIANVTTLLVSIGFDGFGISEATWTIIILIVGLLIGIVTTLSFNSIFYGLAVTWGYIGILIKHTSSTGFNGQYPSIILTLIISIVILVLIIGFIFFNRNINK